MDEKAFLQDELLSDYLVENGKIPQNTKMLWEYKEVEKERRFAIVSGVKNKVELTGDDINDASVGRNQYNEPYVLWNSSQKAERSLKS